MKIIPRYIIKEHTGPFLFSLAVIMFVFVTKFVAQYIGRLFGKGLPFLTILEVIYLNLAWMLALAVPMAVLVATLMAFGRLSADNEITILKTSGVNLYRILSPVLMAAALLTLVMVWYNDKVLPEFNHQARLLFRSIGNKKPTLELEEGLYLNLGNKFNILVEEIEPPLEEELMNKSNILDSPLPNNKADLLKNITIFDYSDPQIQRTIIANQGYLVFNKEREQLVFHLFDGEIHELSKVNNSEYHRLKFFRNVFYIPAEDLVFKRVEEKQRGDREMTIEMLQNQVEKFKEVMQEEKKKNLIEITRFLIHPDTLAKRLAAGSTSNTDPGLQEERRAISRATRVTQASTHKIQSNVNNLNHFEKQIYKYEVEIYKKYSIPFACIVFVLIGAPLGIRARKGSLGVGITFSVGFFLLYWACLIGGEELADRQLVSPALAMWFPNILVGVFGIYLTVSAVRETTFIQWERLPKALQIFFKGAQEREG